MIGTETWIKSDRSFLPALRLSFGRVSGRCHSLFIRKRRCPKRTPLSILTSPLLISNRNPYAQVPHFSQVKEGTGLINHKDWWHSVFVVIERSHKYLILPSPSDDSRSASECLISPSAKWAAAVATADPHFVLPPPPRPGMQPRAYLWDLKKGAVDYSVI